MVCKSIDDDLLVFYVFDNENSMTMITHGLLDDNLTEANIHDLAIANMKYNFNKIGIDAEPLTVFGKTTSVYGVRLDGVYESSLIFLKEFWTKDRFKVNGDFVVFMPSRSQILVAGSRDHRGLEMAARLSVRCYSEANHTISPAGYILQNGLWRKFCEIH